MIIAVVPVKRLRDAKSRLAESLAPEERADLVRQLLSRTLSVLADSGVVDRIAVVTAEPELPMPDEIERLPDAGSLNTSLNDAARWAVGQGARSLLILPLDLPLLTPHDIRLLTEEDGRGIAIARSYDGGTNALLLTPPDVIPAHFGPASYERHLATARNRTVAVLEVNTPSLSRDLDRAEDLELLYALL